MWAAGATADGAEIKGTITDTMNREISGAKVTVVRGGRRLLTQQDLAPLAQSRTNANGQFQLRHQETTQSLALVVTAPRMVSLLEPLKETGADHDLLLRMEKGVDVRGRVMSADNHPVQNAQIGPIGVAEDSEAPGAERIVPQWTQSDAQGRFTAYGLAPGHSYSATVRAAGFQTVQQSFPPTNDELVVELVRGGNDVAGGLMAPGIAPDELQNIPLMMNGRGLVLHDAADRKGEFSFAGIPEGEYIITAFPPPPRSAEQVTVRVPEDVATSVTVRISGGYFITGHVQNAETKAPQAGVQLEAHGAIATSLADGSFRIGPLFAPGSVNVNITPRDRESWQKLAPPGQRVDAQADGLTDVTGVQIHVVPSRLLAVRIPNFVATTQPLYAHVLRQNGLAEKVPVSSATVNVKLVGSGNRAIYASGGSLASTVQLLTMTSGTGELFTRKDGADHPTTTIELLLHIAAQVRGRAVVVESSNTTVPASGYHVTIGILEDRVSTAPIAVAVTQTQPSGDFGIDGLPPARIACAVENPARVQRKEVRLPVGSGLNVLPDFVFTAGHEVSGIVRDENGKPIEGALIAARVSKPAEITARTRSSADGTFRIENLDAVEIDWLECSHDDYLPATQGKLRLPQTDLSLTMRPLPQLRFRVEAPADTVWVTSLMRVEPMGVDPFPRQLAGQQLQVKSIAGGATETIRLPGKGTYYIVARGPLRGAAARMFEWDPEKGEHVVLVLHPRDKGRISGAVQGGPPEVNITANNMLLPQHNVPDESRVVARDGNFELTDLLPGNYLIQAEGEGFASTRENVLVEANKATQVELSGDASYDVRGVVLQGAHPVQGATVSLVPETKAGAAVESTQSDDAGNFIFSAVKTGSYILRASTPDGSVSGQLRFEMKRETPTPPVQVQVSALMEVSFELHGGSPDIPAFLTNTATGETFSFRHDGESYKGKARAGQYELMRADTPAGRADVSADGKVAIMRK